MPGLSQPDQPVGSRAGEPMGSPQAQAQGARLMWHDYLSVQFDPAHLLSELMFELAQFAALAVLWPRFIRPRLRKAHRRFDQDHNLTHESKQQAIVTLLELAPADLLGARHDDPDPTGPLVEFERMREDDE